MSKQNVLVMIGGEWHPFEFFGATARKYLEETGRYTVTVSQDRDLFKSENIAKFGAVVVYASGGTLTKDQVKGLTGYVSGGGRFIGVHCATTAWQDNPEYVDMIGAAFDGHGPTMTFPVNIARTDCAITKRILDFPIEDELYRLKKFDASSVNILATAQWHHKPQPMAYTKAYGEGKVYYLALGHDENAINHPEFKKMFVRGVDWSFDRVEGKPLKVAALGYGKSFKMGKLHFESLRDAAGFTPVAVCDLVPERLKEAEEDFPGIKTYTSASEMLKKSDAELIVVITEHFTHAKLATQCLNAGRHVVTEKPFCVNVGEADSMIEAARKNKRMLSVFHNRRWDGDYMTIKDVIARGLLGEVFQIEVCMSSYNHPGFWWRSDKRVSGGAFYDWGAHIVDWTLNLVPAKIKEISGYFQEKRMWHDVTNEDHCSTMLRFENGCSASIELSSLAAIGKPRWRILGTKGALVECDPHFKVTSYKDGVKMESTVDYKPSDWHAYYRNVADHLLLNEPLAVTPESARRVISVIETAAKSSKAGCALKPPKGCE